MTDRDNLKIVIEKCQDLLEELKEDAKRRTGSEYSINKSAVKRVRLQVNSWLKECEE
jgi:hypothetical protein